MKKKLFTVLAVVITYSLIIVGLNLAENDGLIQKALTFVGQQSEPAYAAQMTDAGTHLSAAEPGYQSFIDPLPRPPYPKPKPKPSPDGPTAN